VPLPASTSLLQRGDTHLTCLARLFCSGFWQHKGSSRNIPCAERAAPWLGRDQRLSHVGGYSANLTPRVCCLPATFYLLAVKRIPGAIAACLVALSLLPPGPGSCSPLAARQPGSEAAQKWLPDVAGNRLPPAARRSWAGRAPGTFSRVAPEPES